MEVCTSERDVANGTQGAKYILELISSTQEKNQNTHERDVANGTQGANTYT